MSPSKASINGHPLHPMIVPFPIAFLVGALVSDLVFAGTADVFWARASFWLILAGLVMGAVAAVLGLTDFLGVDEVRRYPEAWVHFVGNASIMVIALVNVIIRIGDTAGSAVLPWGLLLSAVSTAGLVATGWLGGELAYRHGIGMAAGAGVRLEE